MNRMTIPLVLHVLGAIVGFGPMFVLPPVMMGLAQKGELPPPMMMRIMDGVMPVTRVVDVLQPLTGVWLIVASSSLWDPFRASNRWLLVSIVLYVILMALVYLVMEPAIRRAKTAIAQGGGPEEMFAAMGVVKKVGPLPPLILLTIIVLMVVKPGSGFVHP